MKLYKLSHFLNTPYILWIFLINFNWHPVRPTLEFLTSILYIKINCRTHCRYQMQNKLLLDTLCCNASSCWELKGLIIMQNWIPSSYWKDPTTGWRLSDPGMRSQNLTLLLDGDWVILGCGAITSLYYWMEIEWSWDAEP